MYSFNQIQNLHQHLGLLLEGYHFCVADSDAHTNDADDFVTYIQSVLEADMNELESTLKFCEDNDITLEEYKDFMYNNFQAFEYN